MAITNFISTVWSENLLSSLDSRYIAVSHCNRDFEGEIKGKGSTVKICGVGDIMIRDYTKDTDMIYPQPLEDTVTELTIDQAKYFNFQIDDIDKAQSSPKIMDAAMKAAANRLAANADAHVISIAMSSPHNLVYNDIEPETIINGILDARTKLYKANVYDGSEIFLEVTPEVGAAILKAKLTLPSCDPDTVETGYLGSFAGCKIYVMNNLVRMPTGEGNDYYSKCIMRTKRAITFAEQISEVVAYRPESRFADAIKGLHVYGAKLIYPDEVISLDFVSPL